MTSFELQRWRVLEGAPDSFVSEHPGFHRALLDVLWNRNLRTPADIEQFLSPSLDQMHDPFLFADMTKSCERIFQAIENKELIMIHGDYDADGIGGSVILIETLVALGAEVHVFLPHRDGDGYGMSMHTAEKFVADEAKVVITCDCGISNITETKYLQDNNIDVIITDHHQFKDELPPSFATLHPKLPDEPYPDESLAGGGVAFKFAHGLLMHADKHDHQPRPASVEHFLYSMLDVAAMSTIADMVPLLGESRLIAKFGIEQLTHTSRLGFEILLGDKKNDDTHNAKTFSFGIGPKINAPGRMGSPQIAFDLVRANDTERAKELLFEINKINRQRQAATKEALTTAKEQVESETQKNNPILFAYNDDWPSGIVGLIAGRLKDAYDKPALVMSSRNGGIVGSGRSTDDVNIVQALDEVSEYLEKYGGHPQACGFSLKHPSLLPYFEEELVRVISSTEHGSSGSETVLDAELPLSEISWELVRDLQKMEPHGMKQEKPIFVARNLEIKQANVVGSTGKTIIMNLVDEHGVSMKFVGFGKSDYVTQFNLGDHVDVAYQLGINAFNGRHEIQCSLVDMMRSGV